MDNCVDNFDIKLPNFISSDFQYLILNTFTCIYSIFGPDVKCSRSTGLFFARNVSIAIKFPSFLIAGRANSIISC